MIKLIQAKSILIRCGDPNGWFGARYNMNIYRGCEHHCIYCDSRSECYQIADFDREVLVKVNAIELLEKELPRRRIKGIISTGAMSDPYTPAELEYGLTGRALEVIERFRFPVHITTKSDLITRDIEVLRRINQVRASVSFTLTTTDDALARKIEPGAPLPSQRLRAMALLAEAGIHIGVLMMPILPFIEDTEENILSIVRRAGEAGAEYIIPSFGTTMRAGSRDYFYARLDALFPGLREKYEREFGNRYECPSPNHARLRKAFTDECRRLGSMHEMSQLTASLAPKQLSLF
jgi:DNA repair photolyase